MSDEIVINDKKYQAIRLAVNTVLYSRDYVTRLARERKITAVQLGRRWYVQIESLKAYAETQDQELEIRKKHLRDLRLVEQGNIYNKSKQPSYSEIGTAVLLASVLASGVFLGSQFSDDILKNTNAALVLGMSKEKVAGFKDTETEMLVPSFSENTDVVFVSQDRLISKPGSEEYSSYSQHE